MLLICIPYYPRLDEQPSFYGHWAMFIDMQNPLRDPLHK